MHAALPLKLLWRDWRGGELRLLVAALIIGVSTVSGIALFIDRLQQALILESSSYLAADRAVRSAKPVPEGWEADARADGLDTAQVLTFASMVFGPQRSQLVSVKAVTAGYPLRGQLQAAQASFVPGQPTDALPEPGEVWLDGRLLPALGVEIGDRVEVGNASLLVTQVLTYEPDRGGSFFELGPRLLMRMADVPATGVVQPGSRLRYRLLLRGDDDALEAFREDHLEGLDDEYRWTDVKDASDRIGNALDRAESFLLLGGLLGVILSGVAVALAANRYSQRQYDPVAVLKTFGMTPGEIQRTYLTNLAVLGLAATVIGLALGTLAQFGILAAIREFVPVELPLASWRPYAIGAVTGFVCLLSFALPPLLRLRGISPLRVIRRELDATDASMTSAYFSGLVGSLLLLVWYSGSLALTGWLLLGTFGTVTLLLGVAAVLLRGGRIVGMQAGSGWRLALAGLQRRGRENRVQILVFGLAIMLLLILYLVRTSLIDEWRTQMPDDAPNHFVMNVAPHEVEGLRTFLEQATGSSESLYPMARGRITLVNGVPPDDKDDDGIPNIGSERNLSWSETLPGANEIVDGAWWQAQRGGVEMSLEEEFARETGLAVGDVLTLSVADRTLDATVTSLRKVDWDSLQPNFWIMLSPEVAENLPATYLTSFRLDPERKLFLNDLLRAYPTITVIEIDAVLAQVQRIVDRVTLAVELVLGLVLVAGALVLVASIQSSMDERLREHGLLRALGAGRRRVLGALMIEFGALGLFAGAIAAIGAETTVGLLQWQVFELDVVLHPWVWVGGPLVGVLLIGAIGTLSTRRVVDTPPALVLRETA